MTSVPTIGISTYVAQGGVPVLVVPANINGGVITNPLTSVDQGITTAEPLYVDPTGVSPGVAGNGSTFALQPGQTWSVIPGQTTPTYVNAVTSSHRFSAVWW